MLFTTYQNSRDFVNQARNHPKILVLNYSRCPKGLENYIYSVTLYDCDAVKSALLTCIPVLGTILGLARLYSVWSVKDRSQDSCKELTIYTLIGIMETLGLGLLLLPIRIIASIIYLAIAFFTGLCSKPLPKELR
ncbi:hypothetical protein [Chlamydia vaughanii]|uniref:hypothetical protein n=1 Tax=Chlamydia vaughanii TaxID=3112552 RepID=UPI0032B18D61